MDNKFFYLCDGAQKYRGAEDDGVSFTLLNQLKNGELWQKFVGVFVTHDDGADNGWRGEYFGKMMRGACITYKYRADETLYEILFDTVRSLLNTQDALGRISSYPQERELCGWDIWGRKYVLVGCLYFYGICRDEGFKAKIIDALCRHADYLISKIGNGEGKISVLDTSPWYGGLNSSSILEPIVELYKITGKKRYLDFARYILLSGGCKGGNLIELALAGEKMPFEYPEVKAYEMMSFFEGALAYYEVTGEKKYFNAVTKFISAVHKSDITVIGCAGCTHELFDNSAVKQADEVADGTIMQETCVTVTWMRLCERVLRLTANAAYADHIEKSALNALYGSLNIYGCEQYSREEGRLLSGVAFDSYSPLVFGSRGIGIGGYKKFGDGSYYGCCACIGAAGIGLYPLASVYQSADGFAFNYYHTGTAEGITPNGQTIKFDISGEAAICGKCEITVHIPRAEKFTVSLRIPRWSENFKVTVNGERTSAAHGYNTVSGEWREGDKITVEMPAKLCAVTLGKKTAYTFGAVTLARDEYKEGGDISAPFAPVCENGGLVYERLLPEAGEAVRIKLKTEEGFVLLTDYASCGKHYTAKRNKISVWLNAE